MAAGVDGQPRQYGLTPAISFTLPTEEELRLNESLLAELRQQNNFEATEHTEKRKKALTHLQKVTEEFVRHVGRKKGLAPSVIDAAGGKVSTYGSYRLGVYGPGSDIDTLVVAPKHVSRDDFFEHFPSILERMSPAGTIEELTPVPDAHVPIIKLEYSGISIDLIFTRLAISSVPESIDLKDSSLLRGLSETDLRSINGTRVADEIVSLVPQVKTFRHALRAIKLWAQRRAIYANIMGFPGGVAWALLVARICQLYPMACGATIVDKFFIVMSEWKWPRPVLLKPIESGPLQVRVWNPKLYPGDSRHLMPIITPAYPSMCATHNITHSTMQIIRHEIARARAITQDISLCKRSWKDLFVKDTFFTEAYKYYLSIVSASRSKEAQQIWSGLVQSKVRRLVSGIEMSDTGVEVAHPFNKGFDRVNQCQTEEEVDMIFQGDLRFLINDEKVAEIEKGTSKPGEEKLITIYTTTYYIGLELGGAEVGKKLDITNPVADFKRQCTEWPQYDSTTNSLRTTHTRNYDLPLDVFEEGEKRPEKSKSRKSKSGKAANGSNGTKQVATQSQSAAQPQDTISSGAATDSRKRKPSNEAAADAGSSMKKPNLSNGESTPNPSGAKRGLDTEDAQTSDAKRRQSSNIVTPTPAG